MPSAVKLSDDLVAQAKPYAAATRRSVTGQIEYWARLGKAIEDNPDMPLQLLKDTLLALEEAKSGQLTPFPLSK